MSELAPVTVSGPRVRIVAADETLVTALREQRVLAAGWRIAARGPLEADALEPDALVIVDLEDAASRSRAVERARCAGFDGPILVLGGLDAADFVAESLQRPVRLGALLARVGAHMAASRLAGAALVGPYELSTADCALREVDTGRLVRLTELEIKLLTYLIEAGGALVDREQLLEQVWGYRADADTHTVETHVWRLRQKVETDDPATRFVVTETGGYRLILAGRGRPE